MDSSDSRYRKEKGVKTNRSKLGLFCCAAIALALASTKLLGTERALEVSNTSAEDDRTKAATFTFNLMDNEQPNAQNTTPLFDSSFAEYLKNGLSWWVARAGTNHFFYTDSVFHKTWPNETVPYWTKKRFPLNKYITPDKQTCLMHVGKFLRVDWAAIRVTEDKSRLIHSFLSKL